MSSPSARPAHGARALVGAGRARSGRARAAVAALATTACSSWLTRPPAVASSPTPPTCSTSPALPTVDAALAAGLGVATYLTWPFDDDDLRGVQDGLAGAVIILVGIVWLMPAAGFAGSSVRGFRTVGACRRARRDHVAAHAAWRARERLRSEDAAAIVAARAGQCAPALALVERRRTGPDSSGPLGPTTEPAVARCVAEDRARRQRAAAATTRIDGVAGGITPAIRAELARCLGPRHLVATVQLQISIDPTGAARAVAASGGDPSLPACATAALASARFPSSLHGTQVIYDLPAAEAPP